MTDEELAAAGLLDPERDHPRRGDLLRRCVEIGMTVDEIRDAGDQLVQRAIDALIRRGHAQLTLDEVAARAGLEKAVVDRIATATGFGGIHRDAPVWTDEDVESIAALAPGIELMGEEPVMQIIRVADAAIARVADAITSSFITSAGARATADDESGLALLEANAMGAALLEEFAPWIERSLIRHMRLGFRDVSDAEVATALADGVDTPTLTIGFADLVGSTSHAERRSLVELNAALGRFELAAADVVARHGGRVVKFIGDEVMFRADTPAVAARIALDLVEVVRDDPELPPVRAGLAHGMVLSREGDFHGPTVNMAARVLKLAPMNGVVATMATAEDVGAGGEVAIDSLGAIEMPGVAEPVELAALRRSSGSG